MAGIVIYGSQYGSAKQYAEELAKRTGFELQQCEAAGNLADYDTIVYVGALYAGAVLGMKKAFAGFASSSCHDKKIAIATVGVADPADQEYTDALKDVVKKQLPGEIAACAQIFHLRGAIDYSKLSFKHKTMTGLLYKKMKKMSPEELTADMRALVETYNQSVSFVDFNSLDQILEVLNL